MKLKIKKKFFDLIKSGEKKVDLRDAHITFVCEETGETLRKDICAVGFGSKEAMLKGHDRKHYDKDLFEDDMLLGFMLGGD